MRYVKLQDSKSVYFRKCQKTIKKPYEIENETSRESNPSLHNQICQSFAKNVLSRGKMDKDFKTEQVGKAINNLHPAKVGQDD